MALSREDQDLRDRYNQYREMGGRMSYEQWLAGGVGGGDGGGGNGGGEPLELPPFFMEWFAGKYPDKD